MGWTSSVQRARIETYASVAIITPPAVVPVASRLLIGPSGGDSQSDDRHIWPDEYRTVSARILSANHRSRECIKLRDELAT